MRVVSTNDFRDNLAGYLEAVAETDTPVVVKRFGKPLVIVSPYKEEKVEDFTRFYGFLGEGESGKEFLKRVRRSRIEKEHVRRLRTR